VLVGLTELMYKLVLYLSIRMKRIIRPMNALSPHESSLARHTSPPRLH